MIPFGTKGEVQMKSFHWGALAALVIFASPAGAQNFAIGTQAGTTGIGAEAQYQVTPGLVVRGTADFLGYSRDTTYDDINYTGRLKFATAGAFVDWHPFQSWLFLSGGVYFGQRKVSLAATPTTNVNIDGVNYTPAQVGTLTGAVKTSSAQPFLGFGIDNTFVGAPGLGFKAMVGVAFSSSPAVALASSGGLLSNDPTFQARLNNERNRIRDDARDFQYFPVINVGLTYSF
jgi:hypothetical protein